MGKEKKDKKDKKEKKEKKDKKEKKEKKEKAKESDDESDGSKSEDDGKDNDNLSWDSEEIKNVIKAVQSFITSKGNNTSGDIFDEVRMHQLAQVFDHKMRLYIVLEALCGSSLDSKKMTEHEKVIE